MLRYFRALGRLSDAEERLAKLESALEERDLDWVDMRARCRRLLDRTEKAARRVESAEGGEVEETATPPNGNVASPGRLLTPHQREIQQQILKRRAGL